MSKLARYLVLLAGMALAMLMSVPAAMADNETGPDTEACRHATEKAEEAKEDAIRFLRRLHDRNDEPKEEVVEPVALVEPTEAPEPPKDWENKEISEEKILEILQKIVDSEKAPEWVKEKATELKDALHKARWDRWHACKTPEPQHENNNNDNHENNNNHENTDHADYSQVNDVPVGAVDTGGGPA